MLGHLGRAQRLYVRVKPQLGGQVRDAGGGEHESELLLSREGVHVGGGVKLGREPEEASNGRNRQVDRVGHGRADVVGAAHAVGPGGQDDRVDLAAVVDLHRVALEG